MRFNFFKKFLTKFWHRSGSYKNTEKSRPFKDWKIIIFVFSVINVLVFGASIYMVVQVQRDGIFKAEEGEGKTVKVFDKNKLTEVNDYFDGRERKSNSIRESSSVPDPSI
ncbi:MAG: hypothetical protein Q8P86_02735 [bacterium]|nr:hypothetical protein [bacterium]